MDFYLTLHEMTHALFFSPYLYELYRDTNGFKYSTPTSTTTLNGVKYTGFVTP